MRGTNNLKRMADSMNVVHGRILLSKGYVKNRSSCHFLNADGSDSRMLRILYLIIFQPRDCPILVSMPFLIGFFFFYFKKCHFLGLFNRLILHPSSLCFPCFGKAVVSLPHTFFPCLFSFISHENLC